MTGEELTGLLEKYHALLVENGKLKEEINTLKARLGITEPPTPATDAAVSESVSGLEENDRQPAGGPASSISKTSDNAEKIRLFVSLFRGREDVYARRWESKKKGTAGYSPSCVIDQRVVWYGSINLLSFGGAEESVMRLESPNIAHELIKIMGKASSVS